MVFLLFFSLLSITIFYAISSASLLSMWVALELNTVFFIFLLPNNPQGVYFLMQGVGSVLILVGGVVSNAFLVILGLCINAGIAPFHFWYPYVISHCPWSVCFIMSTFQNVPTMVALSYLSGNNLLYCFSTLSAVLGCLGAIRQNCLNNIFGYSSVSHMGWVIVGFNSSVSHSLFYFSVYLIITYLIFNSLSSGNYKALVRNNILITISLFFFTGIPPLAGLFIKLSILFGVQPVFGVFFLFSSLVICYVYLSIFLSAVEKGEDSILFWVAMLVITVIIFFLAN